MTKSVLADAFRSSHQGAPRASAPRSQRTVQVEIQHVSCNVCRNNEMNPRWTVIALVLVLVCVGGAGSVLRWWWSRPALRPDISPLLSEQQRLRGETALRPCREAADCKWPFVCVRDDRVNGSRCLASECQTDLQCAPGFVCRAVEAKGGYVRLCLDVGTVAEGEPCWELSSYKYENCIQGLNCNRGYCGRPCRIGSPAACPAGMACLDSVNGPSCVPACSDTSCSAGQECVRFGVDLSVCAVVIGQNCDRTPCPVGQQCKRFRMGLRRKIAMWCQLRCSEDSGCPAGQVCVYGGCARTCQSDHDCGQQEYCSAFQGSNVRTCALADTDA